jgi:hypothetical protein
MAAMQDDEPDAFFLEIEKNLENPKVALTDFEWKVYNHKWEEQRSQALNKMYDNPIWNMLFTKGAKKELDQSKQPELPEPEAYSGLPKLSEAKIPFQLNPSYLGGVSRTRPNKAGLVSAGSGFKPDDTKMKKQRRLKLFKFLDDWDTVHYKENV